MSVSKAIKLYRSKGLLNDNEIEYWCVIEK